MTATVPETVETLLTSEPLIAHLATSLNDRPHVAPVWYRYADETVEIVTGGKKLDNIRMNPRVALSVQKDHAGHTEWMVSLLGTARIVDDEEAFKNANCRINAKYGADEDAYEGNTLVRISVGSANYRTY
ncbi:MAG: pyridoxamine 5'-phosphate oxidase family protein [Euryarchaeota archaeon]|nr:pyridoxamine 5'-phosphate oxidase family protein [Euryarchaeota archaeon]